MYYTFTLLVISLMRIWFQISPVTDFLCHHHCLVNLTCLLKFTMFRPELAMCWPDNFVLWNIGLGFTALSKKGWFHLNKLKAPDFQM